MKIVTIVGARPQFIKVAPVSNALKEYAGIHEVLVHTGQHFDEDMSDVFFAELGLTPPDYNFNISGGGHGVMTGAMLQSVEPLLEDELPDWVMVYGDTNSTLAGALAASKMNIPVVHVEAGLRSFNKQMPEEKNRIITDHLSDLLFTPTATATENLLNEGILQKNIHQVGDVMFDAAIMFGERAKNSSNILEKNGVEAGNYVLATVHRASNTDNVICLKNIVQALEQVAKEIPVILPLHPRTLAAVEREGLGFCNVNVIKPVGYLDMVALESQAALIATDSGGVQKEAYFYNVPCVTMRNETEWVELIDMGWNRLARPAIDDIASMIQLALGTKGVDGQPYGTGDASRKISQIICGV